MTTKEKAYLRKIKKFIKDKLINQGEGKIYKCDLSDNSACGCFGSWIAVYHNADGPINGIYIHTKGEEKFKENVSFETIKKLEKIAGVYYLFGAIVWDYSPAETIQKLLNQNTKEA